MYVAFKLLMGILAVVIIALVVVTICDTNTKQSEEIIKLQTQLAGCEFADHSKIPN